MAQRAAEVLRFAWLRPTRLHVKLLSSEIIIRLETSPVLSTRQPEGNDEAQQPECRYKVAAKRRGSRTLTEDPLRSRGWAQFLGGSLRHLCGPLCEICEPCQPTRRQEFPSAAASAGLCPAGRASQRSGKPARGGIQPHPADERPAARSPAAHAAP